MHGWYVMREFYNQDVTRPVVSVYYNGYQCRSVRFEWLIHIITIKVLSNHGTNLRWFEPNNSTIKSTVDRHELSFEWLPVDLLFKLVCCCLIFFLSSSFLFLPFFHLINFSHSCHCNCTVPRIPTSIENIPKWEWRCYNATCRACLPDLHLNDPCCLFVCFLGIVNEINYVN